MVQTYSAGAADINNRLQPTYIQEVVRTLTLAVAPYVPFSQRYTMELAKHSGGDETDGFFNIEPQSMSRDSVWMDTVADYFARNNLDENKMGDMAPNVDHLLTPMAQKLSNLLDTMPESNINWARDFENAVYGELIELHTQKSITEMLDKAAVPLGESSVDMNVDAMMGRYPGLGQTFDIARTEETEPTFTLLKQFFGEQVGDNVVAAEITDSKLKKEISRRLKGVTDPEEAARLMEEDIQKRFDVINKYFRDIWATLDGTTQDNLLYLAKKASIDKKAGAFVGAGVGDLPHQFANRLFRLEAGGSTPPSSPPPVYTYLLPLGETGYIAYHEYGPTYTTSGIPQMELVVSIYKQGAENNSLMLSLAEQAEKELLEENLFFTENTMRGFKIAAANDATLSTEKMKKTDWWYASTVDHIMDPEARVDMWKPKYGDTQGKPTGATTFKSTEMAAMLAAQFRAFKEGGGNAGKEFADAWKEIFAESNEATKLWKKEVTQNQQNFKYTPGITDIAQQGVWSKNAAATWIPEKDPKYGINVSMAPAIYSQAGPSVARFSSKMGDEVKPSKKMQKETGKTGGMMVDDPIRGLERGDFVRRGRVLKVGGSIDASDKFTQPYGDKYTFL